MVLILLPPYTTLVTPHPLLKPRPPVAKARIRLCRVRSAGSGGIGGPFLLSLPHGPPVKMVSRLGFEPRTPALKGRCSTN